MKKALSIVLVAIMLALMIPFAVAEGLENKLVIYTTTNDKQSAAWITAFNEVYPDVEIELVNGTIGELIARVQGEKDAPMGDIVYGGLSSTDGMKYEDLFEKYVSSHDAELIAPSINGMYNCYNLSVVCLAVNTDLEQELGLDIRTYKDLLDPKLEGKIIMADPASSSSAWNNMMNFHSVYPFDSEECWAFIEGLMKNKMAIVSSSSATYKDVYNGEYVVGITYEGGASTIVADGGEDYEIRYPEDGVSGMDAAMAIIKNCQHPEAAKAFVELVTSAEGQSRMYEIYSGARYSNANATRPAESVLGANEDLHWVDRPVEELTVHKDEILAHWQKLYNQYYN